MLFQRIHLASIVEWYAKQAAKQYKEPAIYAAHESGKCCPQTTRCNQLVTYESNLDQSTGTCACVSVWSHHCHKALCAVKDSQSVI